MRWKLKPISIVLLVSLLSSTLLIATTPTVSAGPLGLGIVDLKNSLQIEMPINGTDESMVPQGESRIFDINVTYSIVSTSKIEFFANILMKLYEGRPANINMEMLQTPDWCTATITSRTFPTQVSVEEKTFQTQLQVAVQNDSPPVSTGYITLQASVDSIGWIEGTNQEYDFYFTKTDYPIAEANGPYIGVVNHTIVFNGSNSTDLDTINLNYHWDCGDNNSVTGNNAAHQYDTAGSFSIILTVRDRYNLTDQDTSTVTIYDGNSVDIPGGFVIDADGDGTVESYFNESNTSIIEMKKTDDGFFLIDHDDDGKFDYEYHPGSGDVSEYSPSEEGINIVWISVVVICIVAVIILVFLLKKRGIISF